MLSTEQLVTIIKARLRAVGWEIAADAAGPKDAFGELIPAPDAVLSLRGAGALVQAAVHLSRSDGDISYACTLRLPGGVVATERGRIDATTSTLEVGESRGPFAAGQAADPAFAAPAPAPAEPPPVAAKVASEPAVIKRPAAEPPPAADKAPPVDTSGEHPLLAEVLTGIAATGWYTRRWADLRRTVFPGPKGWAELKDWCADKALECELCFGGSSKTADVQFSRRRRTASP